MKQKIFVSTAVLAMCFSAQAALAKNVDVAYPNGLPLSEVQLPLTGNLLAPGSEYGQSFTANATEATVGLFLEKNFTGATYAEKLANCSFATTVTLNLYSGEGTDPANLLHSADYNLPECFRGFVETNYRDAGINFTIGDSYTISVATPATAGGSYIVPTVTGGAPIGTQVTQKKSRRGWVYSSIPLWGGIFAGGSAVLSGVVNKEYVINDNTTSAAVVWPIANAMKGDHYYRLIDLSPERFTFVSSLNDAEAGYEYTPVNLVNPSTLLLGVVYATGGVPAGMSVSGTGVLSGTPTTPGTYTISLAAYLRADSIIGDNGFGTVTINVVEPAVPPVIPVTLITTLPSGKVGSNYTATNLLTTGTATVEAFDVPAGMTVSATGVLSGKPTVAGTYTIILSAMDADGVFTEGLVTLVIKAATVTPPVPVVDEGGKITEIGNGFIMLETTKVSYTASTVITGTFAIGLEVLFSGDRYADGSVIATKISVK
ncbi:MAG: hypothetical protein M0P64_03440 [Candidatus Pacebacteria bacterium]|jgi:hypothetical protein|nr:hypothetical protein [Candidatus Paceibacterota bacterium]